MRIASFLTLLLIALSACVAGGYDQEQKSKSDQERRDRYLASRSDLSLDVGMSIKMGKIILGMTRRDVMASWGRPRDINKTVGEWGVHEQWVYGSHYLYFENGTLTSWQD